VETWSELETLTSQGVRFAQGFLLGRPGAAVIDLSADVRRQIEALGAYLPQRIAAV
jgi:EAL domain-containing protein (putative c-di-GMP-specific phosphodiesterase class I)